MGLQNREQLCLTNKVMDSWMTFESDALHDHRSASSDGEIL